MRISLIDDGITKHLICQTAKLVVLDIDKEVLELEKTKNGTMRFIISKKMLARFVEDVAEP